MQFSHEHKRVWLFIIAMLVLVGINAGVLKSLFMFVRDNGTYSYIQLIPLVSLYFFFIERKNSFKKSTYGFISGGVVILSGAVVYVVGMVYKTELGFQNYIPLAMVSLLLAGYGIFLFFFGTHEFKQSQFPLLFLIFMIPFPPAVESLVVELFRAGSAEMVNLYFKIGGVQYLRNGGVFHLENLSFYVADECSGIHSGISLLIVSIIAGKLFLGNQWLKIILAVSILPIGWIKNGMRIATLTLLGCYVNPGFMSGPLHRQGGRPFFVLALLFLGIELFILRKIGRKLLMAKTEKGAQRSTV
jgi:exosortase